MSVPLTLLGLLELRPSHGYDLKLAAADREVVVRDGTVSTLTGARP